jgi:hypothetical protein
VFEDNLWSLCTEPSACVCSHIVCDEYERRCVFTLHVCRCKRFGDVARGEPVRSTSFCLIMEAPPGSLGAWPTDMADLLPEGWPPPEDPEATVPTYEELVYSVISRLQARLRDEGRQVLMEWEVNRITMCFSDQEQFYMMHDMADGPLHNLRKRIARRMKVINMTTHPRRIDRTPAEDQISSDSEEEFVNTMIPRAADWPRVTPPVWSDSGSDTEEMLDPTAVPTRERV